jgi:Na+/H+ antiporter NhaC
VYPFCESLVSFCAALSHTRITHLQQKSGGLIGFTRNCGKFATTARLGQFACLSVGLFIFFDDYANCLLAGETMRPLLDMLFVSREKLAFIVDATSAPVASISPVSSWVGFEVGLIQTEIDRIISIEGTEDIGIKTSGFGVFLQSVKYRYVTSVPCSPFTLPLTLLCCM